MPSFAKRTLLLAFMLSTNLYAEPCTVKLYFEPTKKKTLTYEVVLQNNSELSYYIGSDLPTWRMIKGKKLRGQYHPGDLVNLRFSPHKENSSSEVIASLYIFDQTSYNAIWRGKINCDTKNHSLRVINPFFDKKYYETNLKIDKQTNTIWLETQELIK